MCSHNRQIKFLSKLNLCYTVYCLCCFCHENPSNRKELISQDEHFGSVHYGRNFIFVTQFFFCFFFCASRPFLWQAIFLLTLIMAPWKFSFLPSCTEDERIMARVLTHSLAIGMSNGGKNHSSKSNTFPCSQLTYKKFYSPFSLTTPPPP